MFLRNTPLKAVVSIPETLMEKIHTPKRDAIQRFVGHESGLYKDWIVRAVDEPDNPVVQLQAFRDDKRLGDPDKTLEIHTRQVRLEDDELDEAAKTMIRRWLQSLL